MGTDETVGIELKYKTRAMQVTVSGESFHLLDQSAQDIGRYDTLKDIQPFWSFWPGSRAHDIPYWICVFRTA